MEERSSWLRTKGPTGPRYRERMFRKKAGVCHVTCASEGHSWTTAAGTTQTDSLPERGHAGVFYQKLTQQK